MTGQELSGDAGTEPPAGFRRGVRVGVDVGTVRVGVASCDPDGILATPLTVLTRGRGDLSALVEIVTEYEAIEVVVGLPVTLAGVEGPAAEAATAYAARLSRRLAAVPSGPGGPVPIRLVDERMSTVAAARGLRAGGIDTRSARTMIDKAAAAMILQGALDAERAAGAAPGHLLGPG